MRLDARRQQRGVADGRTDLKAFVLQDFLDGNIANRVGILKELGLEDDTERAIADDFAVGVDEITGVSRFAVGGDDLDDPARIVDG